MELKCSNELQDSAGFNYLDNGVPVIRLRNSLAKDRASWDMLDKGGGRNVTDAVALRDPKGPGRQSPSIFPCLLVLQYTVIDPKTGARSSNAVQKSRQITVAYTLFSALRIMQRCS